MDLLKKIYIVKPPVRWLFLYRDRIFNYFNHRSTQLYQVNFNVVLTIIYKIVLRVHNGISLKYSFKELIHFFILSGKYSKVNIKKVRFIDLKSLPIFIITLPCRKDRRDKMTQLFQSSGLSCSFVKGVHGRHLAYGYLKKYFTKSSIKYLSAGSRGCILSHAKTLALVVENSFPYALIFEDDILTDDNFKTGLEEILSSIPEDTEILYLLNDGLCNNESMLFTPNYPRCGQYAYLVSQEGAKKILAGLFPVSIGLGGIDTIIGRMVSKKLLTAYQVKKPICKADLEDSSNIINSSKPFKKIHHSEY